MHICDGSGHTIPSGSGYKVAAPALSTSGCPADGGGVCPSDAAGVKADFTNLTGDDIRALAGKSVRFRVHDVYADQDMTSTFSTGEIAFYGELQTHKGATNLASDIDVWHAEDAESYCHAVVATPPTGGQGMPDISEYSTQTADAIWKGVVTGGPTQHDPTVRTLYMGNIGNAIKTGGDTNPEIFVGGIIAFGVDEHNIPGSNDHSREFFWDGKSSYSVDGARYPDTLVFVNGQRSASTKWSMVRDGNAVIRDNEDPPRIVGAAIGYTLPQKTSWNLSDAYYVNNWPGKPYTDHKGNADTAYPFVTQVNYITGYFCAASLH